MISEACAQALLDSLTPAQASSMLYGLEKSLVDFHNVPESVQQPLRSSLTRDSPSVTTLVMPVADRSGTATKIVSLPKNGDISAVTTVMDPEGKIVGMAGAAELTAFRTALSIMCVYTKWQNAQRVVIFGAGKQAVWHIKLLRLLTKGPAPEITVVNRSVDRLNKICTSLNVKGFTDDSNAIDESLEKADAIFCCTPSLKPLFGPLPDNKPRFIGLIGSYKPIMHEISTETLRNGRLFVDSAEACLEESGEIIDAGIKKHEMTEIGSFLTSPERLTGNVVVKCVGMGLMDLFASRELIKLAKETGVGQEVDM